jgi:hypothetical protein
MAKLGPPSRKTLEGYRRDIHRYLPALFDAVETQVLEFTQHVHSLRQPQSIFEVALAGHLFRSTDCATAVVRIAEYGHGEMALGASRIVFEAMVSAYWLAVHPEARAQQYEDFAGRENHDTLKTLRALGFKPPDGYPNVRQEIAARVHFTTAFPKASQGWSRRTFDQRVSDIAPHFPRAGRGGLHRFARVADTFGNRMLHVGTGEVLARLKTDPWGAHLGPHPMTANWSALALHATAWAYSWTVQLAAEHMQLCDPVKWRRLADGLLAQCRDLTGVKN